MTADNLPYGGAFIYLSTILSSETDRALVESQDRCDSVKKSFWDQREEERESVGGWNNVALRSMAISSV